MEWIDRALGLRLRVPDLEAGTFVRHASAGTCARLPSPAVRLAVDLTLCQGYAQCAFLAPDVFRFVGNEALMYVPEPDESMRVNVLRAAAACPVGAILVDVDDLSIAP